MRAAEDNPINRTVVRMMLEQAGRAVDVVENGAEALEALRAGGHDLVPMDIRMPPPLGGIPVVALTAEAMAGALDAALAAARAG